MDSGAPFNSDVDSPPPPPPPSLPVPPPPARRLGDAPSHPPGLGEQWVQAPKVAGRLSPMWRIAFGVGWAAIIACQAAVWETSRVIGLSTWWLGPDAEPRLVLFQLLPFYGPILVTIAAISNWRYSPYLGIAVAAAGSLVGLGDLGRARWIAVVELVVAGAALCISVASLAGMYRPITDAGPVS